MESAEKREHIPIATNMLLCYVMRGATQNVQKMLSVHSELDWFEPFV
jgi:hypothetical protein